MMDIIKIEDGQDLFVQDSIVPKAANLLSIQIGSLEYAKEFGIDLKFFLDNPIVFQNESFKSYMVQKLAQNLINVSEIKSTFENLFSTLNLKVDSEEEMKGFIL